MAGFFDDAFSSLGSLFNKGNIGSTVAAAGNLVSGFGQAQGYGASAKAEAANAALVRANTKIALTQAGRDAYTQQGAAKATAGASGLSDSGSIADILAMNARNASEEQANISKLGEMQAGVHDAAASDAKKAGKTSQLGGIIGAVGSIASIFSDERLKDILETVRIHEKGFRIVKFRYKGGVATWEGVVAQEVQKVFPQHVREIGGYLAVDYKAIGVEMKLVS